MVLPLLAMILNPRLSPINSRWQSGVTKERDTLQRSSIMSAQLLTCPNHNGDPTDVSQSIVCWKNVSVWLKGRYHQFQNQAFFASKGGIRVQHLYTKCHIGSMKVWLEVFMVLKTPGLLHKKCKFLNYSHFLPIYEQTDSMLYCYTCTVLKQSTHQGI